MNDFIELEKVSIEKKGVDILVNRYKPQVIIEEDDAREIDASHISMSHGNEMFVIVDLTQGGTKITSEAESFFVSKGKMIPYIKATAIVTNEKHSFFSKLFGKTSKAIYPTRKVSTIKEASDWFDSMQ